MTQQGDVVLFQSLDDGEIVIEGGLATMDGGLQTAVYLSLFGGNEDDDGLAQNPKTWWANLDENQPVLRYRSRLQNLLRSIPFFIIDIFLLDFGKYFLSSKAVKSDTQIILSAFFKDKNIYFT